MFIINGILWNLIFVNSNDERLIRSDGLYSLAVTDWNEKSIYLYQKILKDLICVK